MIRKFAAAAALVLVCGMAVGQDKPYGFEYANKIGTLKFHDRSLDEVWKASVHVFMTQNLKGFSPSGPLVKQDRPSKTMDGNWIARIGLARNFILLNLIFEEEADSSVMIYCTPSGLILKKDRILAIQKFFDSLVSNLYGIQEPQK